MKKLNFSEALAQIMAKDQRYDVQAYQFVREALDFTIKLFSKPLEGPGRHVSGAELQEGVRRFALQEFGPMAKTVLNHWGMHRTDDIGAVVFNLVETGILGKTDEDDLADFTNGYDFEEAFRAPFRPQSARSETSAEKEP